MSDREPSLDRRALLAATGATAAGSIAGCADIIESAVEGFAESTKSFDATPAGVSREGARRLGLPATNTTEYRTRRTPTIGGDRYLLFETHQLTSYDAETRIHYKMGVLSTPLARIDGTPSNPLATDSLESFLTGEHGERFIEAIGAPGPIYSGASRISRTSGPTMLGASATTEVYVIDLPSRKRVRRGNVEKLPEDWYAVLTRVRSSGDAVILGCLVDARGGRPDTDTESRARDLAYDAASTVTTNPSWSGSQVPSVTVEDVRPVQTLEESTVQGGTDIPDPDLVEREPTAAMFTLRSSSSPTLPAYLGTTVTLNDYRGEFDWMSFDVRKRDAAAILGSGDAPAVLHEATQSGTWEYGSGAGSYSLRVPVFTARDDMQKVSVEVATPVGVHVDIAETTDVSITEMAPLRVGFIELRDPGATKNTDIDFGDANGRAQNYGISVQSSFQYLQHAFPGQVVAYSHDSPMVGNIKENFGSGTEEDAREARTTLNDIRQRSSFPSNGTILTEDVSRQDAVDLLDADTGGAFDVTVMILPRANSRGHQHYFAAHGMSNQTLGYYWGNKKAVGSLEANQGGSNMGHVSTTAQEIGHYLVESLYSGARARTKPDGSKDRMHASGNIRTIGYDLTDGTYRLVTNPSVSNGTFGVDSSATDANGNPVTTSYASYMSYAAGPKWADGLIHSELMGARHTVSPDLAGAAGTKPGAAGSAPAAVADADADLQEAAASVQPVIEAFGIPGTDGVEFNASVVYDAVPVDADGGTYDPERHEDARPVYVALRDPAGETLVTATVPDRVHGSHGDLAFESVALSLPFPPMAVSLVATHEDADTRLNPIVHPLRVAVAEIPPRGTDNVDANRVALEEALDEAAARMSDGEYGEAASVLDGSFREAVQGGVVEYEAFANQPTSERLLALTDRMVERLVGLAEADVGPSGTIAVHLPDGTRRCVEPVEGAGSVQEYYGYGRGTSDSSSTPDGLERDDATVTFVYRNAETGALSLVCLNGDASGTTDGGGRAPMTFRGVSGYEWQVQDGRPGSGTGDFDPYETEEGPLGESESVIWGWDDTKTDGGAIGPLGETFTVDVVHRAEATVRDRTDAREGLDSWLFVDGGALDEPIELASFTGETGEVTITVSDDGCR